MSREEQLIETVNVVANLIRSVHLKRVLADLDAEPALNFWRVMHGNLLDMGVIEWCKLFGSDDADHQKIHWKNVIPQNEQDAFRAGMLETLGIDKKQFDEYWKEMKNYRDQHAAHRDFHKNDVTHYPIFDLALESTYVYYDYLITELRKEGVSRFPDDIRGYCDKFAAQARKIAEQALAATKEFKEEVH
jgi:hypothetical protein